MNPVKWDGDAWGEMDKDDGEEWVGGSQSPAGSVLGEPGLPMGRGGGLEVLEGQSPKENIERSIERERGGEEEETRKKRQEQRRERGTKRPMPLRRLK